MGGWTPVDESASGWTPVASEPKQAAIPKQDYAIQPQLIGPLAGGITKSQAQAISKAFPAAGATIGALLGEGWASVPGAALGGAAGRALQQLTGRWLGTPGQPETSGQAAKDIGTEGVEQGVIQGVAHGAGELAAPAAKALKTSAGEALSKVFAPTKAADKAIIQKALPRLINESPIAISREGLSQNIGTSLRKAGQTLDDALASIPGNTPIPPQRMQQVAGALSDEAKQFMAKDIHGNLVTIPSAEPVVGLYRELGQFISNAEPSFENIRTVRKALDGLVDKSGNWNLTGAETSIKEIQRGLANDLRGALADTGGQAFQKANKDYSFYKGLQQVLEHTQERTTGQQGNLTKRILTAGGVAHGGITGGVIMGALAKAMDSTAWRTVSAATKSKIADAIANDNLEGASALLTRTIQTMARPSLPNGWNYDENGRPVRENQ